MSRIGRLPISIPDGVTVEMIDDRFVASGSRGKLEVIVHPKAKIDINTEAKIINVGRAGNDRIARAIHGLMRMLVANAVTGVSAGFNKKLEMHGIGYRAQTDGHKLTLTVGFSHPVEIVAPEGITFNVDKNTAITVSGNDKQAVGQIAADIRAVKKPEPYKGKGIRYEGEYVRRKTGKAAKTGK